MENSEEFNKILFFNCGGFLTFSPSPTPVDIDILDDVVFKPKFTVSGRQLKPEW